MLKASLLAGGAWDKYPHRSAGAHPFFFIFRECGRLLLPSLASLSLLVFYTLSLTYTHTHTHTHSLSLSLSLSLPVCRSLSLFETNRRRSRYFVARQ